MSNPIEVKMPLETFENLKEAVENLKEVCKEKDRQHRRERELLEDLLGEIASFKEDRDNPSLWGNLQIIIDSHMNKGEE